MSGLDWVLVILGAGAGTYLLRVSPFLWKRLRKLGQEYFHFLTYVSLAIAAGIVSRSIAYSGGRIGDAGDIGIKVLAVLAALGLLRLTKSLPLALFAGIGIAVLIKSFE
jgi:branched-subunit amino acid transport protein